MITDWLVYFVAVLLLASLVLYIKVALFDRRPQKIGLIYVLLAVPLYVIYYADRWPKAFGTLPLDPRDSLAPLENVEGADTAFVSDVAPAFMVALLLLVHMTVLQRVGVRQRLQRIMDPVANFFASGVVATLLGGIAVGTFHLGWVGAIIVAIGYVMVYLGVLALVASIVQIFVELGKYIALWLRRRAFTIATWITRVASFVSSLSGRLGLTTLADRIRAETEGQETKFGVQQELQDRELYEAFVRDRAKQRKMQGKSPLETTIDVDEAITAETQKTQRAPEQRVERTAEIDPAPRADLGGA